MGHTNAISTANLTRGHQIRNWFPGKQVFEFDPTETLQQLPPLWKASELRCAAV